MASGKTTFGRAAAEKLGWDFVDLDAQIEARYGTTAEIFAQHGESFFRDVETQMLGEALQAERDTVLALGGGTILREENQRLVKEAATLLWLDTDFDIILSEIGNADRPLIRGRNLQQIRQLYDDRRPLYAAAADIVFPVSSFDYGQVIDALTARIAALRQDR